MNMPAFTAEIAVYKSTTTYLTRPGGISHMRGASITPQQLPLGIGRSIRISDAFIEQKTAANAVAVWI